MVPTGSYELNAGWGNLGTERAAFEIADQHWRPDLDDDGNADLIVLDDDEVRFAVQSNGDYTTVRNDDGSDLVVGVSEEATVTCSADGVFVQTFERGVEQPVTNALRLSRLEVSGSTGTLIPNPSFFGFDSDFELPRLGSGCPPSE
jgi:hypothetical protein